MMDVADNGKKDPVAEALAALAPFAGIADDYDDAEEDEFQVWKDFDVLGATLPLRIFRAARKARTALAEVGGPAKPFAVRPLHWETCKPTVTDYAEQAHTPFGVFAVEREAGGTFLLVGPGLKFGGFDEGLAAAKATVEDYYAGIVLSEILTGASSREQQARQTEQLRLVKEEAYERGLAEGRTTRLKTESDDRDVGNTSDPEPVGKEMVRGVAAVAEARIAALAGALEPFASLARMRHPDEGGSPSVIDIMTDAGKFDELELRGLVSSGGRSERLQGSDFRCALEALEEKPKPPISDETQLRAIKHAVIAGAYISDEAAAIVDSWLANKEKRK